MKIAIGNDHAGFALKAGIVAAITANGGEVVDCGAYTLDPNDDYPDFAAEVARAVIDGRAERGVLVCGS
ncbi:MAG TPA: RpiB/LacA/LacB family sugar-phosphate isomerase, partial [Casimicrobiaceae bacterium]